MSTAPFIIVADRAQLKVYETVRPPGRPAALRMVETLRLNEPQERYDERYTDRAGAFPNGGTAGQGNSIAERMTVEAETDMRSFRKLAGEIISTLEKHRPDRWAFAAPAEINGAILDGLPENYRQSLLINLPLDLVNASAADVVSHFEKAQPPA